MRTFDRCDTLPPHGVEEICVLSWNLLAPSYDRDGSLAWDHRFSALKQALLRFGTCDVMCFQEVDVANSLEELRTFLSAQGFAVVVQERKGFPVVNATFYKSSRFQVVWNEHRSRALIVGLLHKNGQQVCVVNVHLEAGVSENNEKQRSSQLASCLKRVRGNTVICGDFNSPLEHESVLQSQLASATLVRAPIKGFTYTRGGYSDMLDHIWASEALQVIAVIGSESTAFAAMASTGLPNADNPSDHLPVAALYCLKSSSQLDASNLLGISMPASPDTDICLEWLEITRLAPVTGTKREKREHKKIEQAFLKLVGKEPAANLNSWRVAAANLAKEVVASAVSSALGSLAVSQASPRSFDPGKSHASELSEHGMQSDGLQDLRSRMAGA